MPGLLEFHLGAFLVATKAGIPVLPVAIRGTRSILRAGQWFPRRGSLIVRTGQPLTPEGGEFQDALQLRDAARAAIQAHVGEPDLVHERLHLSKRDPSKRT